MMKQKIPKKKQSKGKQHEWAVIQQLDQAELGTQANKEW